MNTLFFIKELLSFYKESQDRKYFIEKFNILKDKYPHLLYPLCDSNICFEDAVELFENIKKIIKNSFVPIYPTLLHFTDYINGDIIETPIFDGLFNECKNDELFINGSRHIHISNLNDFLLSLLISLPINKIKITFVELDDKNYGDFFYQNINFKLYNLITKEDELKNYIDRLNKRIEKVKEVYGTYSEYCLKNKVIPVPYEIIIAPKYSNKKWYDGYKRLLEYKKTKLKNGGVELVYVDKSVKCKNNNKGQFEESYWGKTFQNGGDILSGLRKDDVDFLNFDELCLHRFDSNSKLGNFLKYCGLYELPCGLYNSNKLVFRRNVDSSQINNFKLNAYQHLSCDTGFVVNRVEIKKKKGNLLYKCMSITSNENLLRACIDYINNEINEEAVWQDYVKNFDSIAVPVGKTNTEVNFTMDMVSHVHSFIIGQSGSGKSVFLHNIIGSAILKYAPEDLQLYLLDFKLGGVEFNRYKGIKHVKSLLVDNSDQQITLEILRELREGMVERGRQLRDCGVNNIVEYNKQNPNATMPQILVVVDECHEMFRVGSDIPRTVSNEISEIITKVAKEGRSQGVHLILATQTLSGTEISNEILNNVSDHYLLKCATVDSERMVERSSEITSQLSTGQIYYHHVDSQVQFQAYYTDKENAEKLIDLAKKKAENHQSNGEFYFNGSQLFKLDTTIVEQGKKRAKYPVAYMGKNISINQNDLNITLHKDYSENILLFGLNDVEQVTRTTMNLFISLILTTKCKGVDIQFKVFNCLSNEDSIYTEQLEMLEEEGYCEIIEGRKDRGKFLKQLAEDISNETAENTILVILGQERFRELKMDMEISQEQSKSSSDDAFGFGGFSFSNESTSSSSIKTFKQALEFILDKGPELGVHTVMQLDKPSNFLFSDYISPKMVYQKFKHLIMLKSDESVSAQLHLNDNIRLETLSKDLERLRAYYYSEESDTYTLFTPYMELNNEEIMNLLKSE